MSKILIFAGTTEGRRLAEILSKNGIQCVCSVATDYGEMIIPKLRNVTVHTGRMNVAEMHEFILSEKFDAVVDATHPFAIVVSENIRAGMDKMTIPYMRLKRNTMMNPDIENDTEVCFFESILDCAKALDKTTGNILLTTGSKDLAIYCQNESIRERLYVRILPGMESLSLCEAQGIRGKHIIAMQGPFGVEMNQALIRQFNIKCLVTKESGISGGYQEKLSAAKAEQIAIFVIGNPEKEKPGDSFGAVCKKISEITGVTISNDLALIGMGMGTNKTLTIQAMEWIKQADYVFGAPRLLEHIVTNGVIEPYYLAKDILPYLNRLSGMGMKIAVLFSGDTGFYSGCSKLYEELKERPDCQTMIYPGISSVSYMSSITGIPWEDAVITSIHGHEDGDRWKTKLMGTIHQSSKTYLLMSGAKDVRTLGVLMKTEELRNCEILVGYQLSYSSEKLMHLTPEECEKVQEEGLYICVILNSNVQRISVSHGMKDDCFIRDKVPMTKEEIREISICKLNLQRDSVVYDIGSGTGSIAIEIAKRSRELEVYAIEKKNLALNLIWQNKNIFKVHNLTIVEGEAPEALEALPVPTHVFIGGSGGYLMEILDVLYQKNPKIRVVMNAISLETISELSKLKEDTRICDLEMIQVQVNRAKQIGTYQLMQAENPVYICSFCFQE